jgi:hypothetical protein
MKKTRNDVKKFIAIKGLNYRIGIYLIINKEDKYFVVQTKRLNDFKSRIISETQTKYSIETFKILQEAMLYFTDNHNIKNKLLLKEFNNIKRVEAHSNLNSK